MQSQYVEQLDLHYAEKLLGTESDFDKYDISEFMEQKWVPDELDQLWVENYKANKDKIVPFQPTRWGKYKAGIFVGASPALQKNYEALYDCDDKFYIICSPTTLKFLLERDIKPDFVFAVEGRDHWIEDFDCDTSGLTLVASPFIPPAALEKWQGEYYFYLLGGGREYQKLLEDDWLEKFGILEVGGGNSISTSFLWAFKFLGMRHFVFVGTSFCYYDDYYMDGRPQPIESLDKWQGWFGAMDIHGQRVDTTPTLIAYKLWLESAMKSAVRYGAEFVNATEDGILGVWPDIVGQDGEAIYARRKYVPWINILPLNLTIEAYKEKLNGIGSNSRQ